MNSVRSRVSSSSIRTSTSAATSSNAFANTGNAACSPRPMPTRCEPWPVNSTASLPSTTASPEDAVARPSTSSSLSPATTTARWVRPDLLVSKENARSVRSTSVDTTCSRSRSACSFNASGDFAASTTGTAGSVVVADSTTTSATGACSMMAWALVPLMPNDEIAARRGRPVSGHAAASVSSSTDPEVQSICGDGSSTCRVFGATPCWSASTILMIPETPEAAWVWPMLDFNEPSSSRVSRSWP